MNITFMMGNGFDVGLGFSPKFADFFPTYVMDSKTRNLISDSCLNVFTQTIKPARILKLKQGSMRANLEHPTSISIPCNYMISKQHLLGIPETTTATLSIPPQLAHLDRPN